MTSGRMLVWRKAQALGPDASQAGRARSPLRAAVRTTDGILRYCGAQRTARPTCRLSPCYPRHEVFGLGLAPRKFLLGLLCVAALPLAMLYGAVPDAAAAPRPVSSLDTVILSCSAKNDLYRVLQDNGLNCRRFETPERAVEAARVDSGVLLLAQDYPRSRTTLSESLLWEAKAKGLRIYVEFPASLPGLEVKTARTLKWGRAVVASDAFGPALTRLRLLDLHDCYFLPVSAPSTQLAPDLVLGRVAGFNDAVFGLPDPAFPLLFQMPQGNLLVATTKLSQFVTARYAPTDAWMPIWWRILHWVNPGLSVSSLHWRPTVRPSYNPNERLPANCELEALRRGVAWYKNSRLLVPAWREAALHKRAALGFAAPPPADKPVGNGALGILEGYMAAIQPDGTQPQSIAQRSDCTCESAMAFAFGGDVLGRPRDSEISKNLLDFLYFTSDARKREYADPKHGAYGLIAWGMTTEAWRKATYGDDEARVLLGTMAASSLLKENRWDEPMMKCLLADLRTTGRLGFREERIDLGPLMSEGWRHFFNQSPTLFAPHYEAYLWACFLWAYHRTGFKLFLERAESAIRLTMRAYPDRWRWTNGMQQERARMLLPLAWLVRVDDTPEHRAWLKRMATDLLALQDKSGAIREQIGALNMGQCRPPQSNAAYGTAEAPLLQENGDPVCDLLYTCNFAFLGLHEAAAATGDSFYARAETRLARFLCRIQVKSKVHPELDGGWYRAFDFRNWEYWASSSDAGWGAWSIETGWTQGWICAVLAMRQMQTSLWNLSCLSHIQKDFARLRPVMIPDDALLPPPEMKVRHAAVGKHYKLRDPYSLSYPGSLPMK